MTSSQHPAQSGPIPAEAGIGLRAPHFEQIVEERPDIPWLEFHPENYLGGGAPYLYLERIRAHYPMSMHGVGLSLGAADGLDKAHLARLAELAAKIEPGLISEHLSFARVGDAYLNDLLPLPYTEEALAQVVSNVQQAQDAFQRPILVENASAYMTFTASTMSEQAFLAEVCKRAGCMALLDVNNVYVNARNHNFDAAQFIAETPADIIGEIHLAGHAINHFDDGKEIRIDDHGSHVDAAVWTLFEQAIQHAGRVPALIEWDTRIPALDVLQAEAARAEAIMATQGGAADAA
jgi:uncharacterized protein (UPF0276 family)